MWIEEYARDRINDEMKVLKELYLPVYDNWDDMKHLFEPETAKHALKTAYLVKHLKTNFITNEFSAPIFEVIFDDGEKTVRITQKVEEMESLMAIQGIDLMTRHIYTIMNDSAFDFETYWRGLQLNNLLDG